MSPLSTQDLLDSASFGYVAHKKNAVESGDFSIIDVNRTFEVVTGLQKNQICGKKLSELSPENQHTPFNWQRLYSDWKKNHTDVFFDLYSDNLQRWYKVQVLLPAPDQYATLFLDITDEKNKLSEFERFFSINLDLLCIAKTDGSFIKVNNEWAHILGYPAKEIEKKNFLDFIHPEDLSSTYETLSQLESQKKVFNFTNRFKRKDGTYRHIEWRSHPVGKTIYAAARDITHQKELQEELAYNRDQFHSLISHIPGATYRIKFGQPSHVLFLGKQIEDISGYDPKELITPGGQTLAGIIHDADKSKVTKDIGTCIRSNKSWELIYRIVKKDGGICWVEDRGKAIIGNNGDIRYLDGFIMDITQRKQAESVLIEKEERLHEAQQVGNTGHWEFNIETQSLYWSDQVYKIYEQPLTFSPTLDSVIKLYHPEEQDDIKNTFLECVHKQKDFTIETRIITPSGKIKYAIQRAKITFDKHHNHQAVLIGSVTDITESKEKENELLISNLRFQQLTEHSRIITWEVNTEGKFTYISDAVERVLGYKAEDVIGHKIITDLIPKNTRERYREKGTRILYTRKTFNDLEFVFESKEGTSIWFSTSGIPITDNGRFLGFRGTFIDITERKQVREHIQKKEAYLRSLIESMNDLVFVLNDDLIFEDIQQPQTDKFFLPPEAFIGKSIYETALPEPALSKICKAAEFSRAKKKTQQVEYALVFPDGLTYHFHMQISPIFGENQAFVGLTCVTRDISELKKIEAHLLRNNLFLDSILKTQEEMICRFLPDTTITFANDAYCALFNFSRDDIIGEKMLDIIDEKEVEKVKNLHKLITFTNPSSSSVQRVTMSDGSKVWQEWTDHGIFDDQGELIELQTIGRDITKIKEAEQELRESEEKLQLFFQQSLEGFFFMILDEPIEWNEQVNKEEVLQYALKNQKLTKVNQAMLDQYGATESQFIGITPLDLFKHDPQQAYDLTKALFEQGRLHSESREQRVDGTPIIIDGDYICLYDEQGRITGQFGAQRDITDKKEAEQALLKAKEQAETANKAKSEFLANMSHEIRTPLNGVIGFTELLLNTPLNSVQQEYAEYINTSGQALLGIINDVLDLSKIEAGKLELDIIRTDVMALAEESSDIIKHHASQKGLELLLNIAPDIPKYAQVDPVRLKQILTNLLSNAVKFTEKGEVELTIEFKKQSSQKGTFTFSVRDTGIGITDEQQKKLFKSFSQADSSTTRKYGGTGLGLTISNLLASKMGSAIQLESEENQGSTFSFTIDTGFLEDETKKPVSLHSVNRVLVIDDNQTNRLILIKNLAYRGINHKECGSGRHAIDMLKKDSDFDLIIIDFHMPKMDGLETVRQIRNDLHLETPVLLLHSSADDALLNDQVQELRIHQKLIKPVKAGNLYDSLKNLGSSDSSSSKTRTTRLDQIQKPDTAILKGPQGCILIAEDVIPNLRLVISLLSAIAPGLHIIEARNGKEAIDMAQSHHPDMILMDIQMPEMDGIEATRLIRQSTDEKVAAIPIIALTAGALKQEKEKCFKAGMNAFLSKPIEVDKLRAVLEDHLNLSGK